jgi:type III restriction enzyme
VEKVTVAFADAQVDLNPHQIDAALFAFKSPLSRGALLADEVGLGKTIEESGVSVRDAYRSQMQMFPELTGVHINIFNISKINSEVRGGKSPRIKRLSEYIGESYFDYLAGLPDLVLLMDESHRYRASAGVRAINELKPILGLELTATPFVESGRGAIPFKNVIYDYPLGKAMVDGFVKDPAVVTRKNFNPAGMSAEEIERLKLEDGIRLHESVKVELETYARESGNPIVKPFLLVIARDTTHAAQLLQLIQSEAFFEGRYKDKAIQMDSSQSGKAEEEMIERLLKVEHADEPTEIVIHVNMLKEGWDVTNLYIIVPLRAANARILIEQSIGRGLRLPYGKRTGVMAVDRLNIVAHDKFQEIIDEANRPESAIRLQAVVLDDSDLTRKTATMVSRPRLEEKLGLKPAKMTVNTRMAGKDEPPLFTKPEEQKVAQMAWEEIRKLSNQPQILPSIEHLQKPEIQAAIVRAVAQRQPSPEQMALEGFTEKPDIEAVVAKTSTLVAQQTARQCTARFKTYSFGRSHGGIGPARRSAGLRRPGQARLRNPGQDHPDHDPIREKDMRPIAAVAYWQRQRKMWAKLAARRLK